MHRREALRSVVAAIAGSAFAAAPRPPQAPQTPPPRAAPARPRFIEASDGTHLFYRDWGTGFSIVFTAPWGLNADWWDSQMTMLSEQGCRYIAYDRRGHGRSDEPGRGYDFDTLADDLQSV